MNKIVNDYLLETTQKRGTTLIRCNHTVSIVNRAYTVLVCFTVYLQ